MKKDISAIFSRYAAGGPVSLWNRGQDHPKTVSSGANFYPKEVPWSFADKEKQNNKDLLASYHSPSQPKNSFLYTGQTLPKPGMSKKKENLFKFTENKVRDQGNLAAETNMEQMNKFLFYKAQQDKVPVDTYSSQIKYEQPLITADMSALFQTPHWQNEKKDVEEQYAREGEESKKSFDIEAGRLSAMLKDLKNSAEGAKKTVLGEWDGFNQRQGETTLNYQNRIQNLQALITKYEDDYKSIEGKKPALEEMLERLRSESETNMKKAQNDPYSELEYFINNYEATASNPSKGYVSYIRKMLANSDRSEEAPPKIVVNLNYLKQGYDNPMYHHY